MTMLSMQFMPKVCGGELGRICGTHIFISSSRQQYKTSIYDNKTKQKIIIKINSDVVSKASHLLWGNSSFVVISLLLLIYFQ